MDAGQYKTMKFIQAATFRKEKCERRLFVAKIIQLACAFCLALAIFVIVNSVREQLHMKKQQKLQQVLTKSLDHEVKETVLRDKLSASSSFKPLLRPRGSVLSAYDDFELYFSTYGTDALFVRKLYFATQFTVLKDRISGNVLPHVMKRKRRSQRESLLGTNELPFDDHNGFSSELWYNTIEEKSTLPVEHQLLGEKVTRAKRKDPSDEKVKSLYNFNEKPSYKTLSSDVYQITASYCKTQFINESENNQTSRGGHNANAHNENEDARKDLKEACQNEIRGDVPALWTLLYIFIILCLFVGLAIICDNFFVPSLEAISEKLRLSEDVAGATFMAAGSSAPELFTSVAGVGTGSDVGVGTIVGSAVFNLLVIIALTSALSGRVLQIDWRPLVRDSTFYGISIAVFIFFSWDGYFQWWESVLLLFLYVLYIITMRFNSQLMTSMRKAPCNSCFEAKDGRVSPSINEDVETSTSDHVNSAHRANQVMTSSSLPSPNMTHRNVLRKSISLHSEENTDIKSYTCCCQCCCCQSRNNTSEYKTVATRQNLNKQKAAETLMKSPTVSPLNSSHSQNSSLILCTECTKGQVDKNGYPGLTSQKKTEDSITRQYPKRGSFEVELNDASISLEVRWNTNKNEEAMNGSRKKLHVTPPPPYDNLSIKETTTTCPQCGATNTTTISENNIFSTPNCELSKGQKSNRKRSYQLATGETTITQNEMSEQEITYKETSLELDLRDGAPKPNELHVSNNSPSSEAGSSQLSPHERTTDSSSSLPADGENELLSVFPCLPPIRHSTPEKPDSSNCAPSVKYFGEWIIYVLSLPWLCIFTWSVPDCSKAENKKWFMLSFVISIAWIAGLSYLMVEVVEKVGCLLGIDTYTMGLVVIAIGTSVPDAISSVLVAKAGYADMAVSNAIGSNVFDINLGLGFPFLFASIVSGKPVHLLTPFQSCLLENLPLSIRMIPHVKFGFILLLILFICLTIFFLFRFKLNRTVGLVFFSMYFIFLIYAFVQEKSCYAFFC